MIRQYISLRLSIWTFFMRSPPRSVAATTIQPHGAESNDKLIGISQTNTHNYGRGIQYMGRFAVLYFINLDNRIIIICLTVGPRGNPIPPICHGNYHAIRGANK